MGNLNRKSWCHCLPGDVIGEELGAVATAQH